MDIGGPEAFCTTFKYMWSIEYLSTYLPITVYDQH